MGAAAKLPDLALLFCCSIEGCWLFLLFGVFLFFWVLWLLAPLFLLLCFIALSTSGIFVFLLLSVVRRSPLTPTALFFCQARQDITSAAEELAAVRLTKKEADEALLGKDKENNKVSQLLQSRR